MTLLSGQQNASSVDAKSAMHRFELRTSWNITALESGAVQKLNHKSQSVRIRLRGLEALSGGSELDAHIRINLYFAIPSPSQNTIVAGEGGAGAFSRSELAPAQWGCLSSRPTY